MAAKAGICIGALAASLWLLGGGCFKVQEQEDGPASKCTACHGSADREGTALEQAAPPFDLDGNTTPEKHGVGAHQLHLRATDSHAAVACAECHLVPETVHSAGHIDTAAPAELTFGALARQGGRAPAYDAGQGRCAGTYCHLATEPSWTAPPLGGCMACHGLPPPPPHPAAADCTYCHGEVFAGSIIAPERHIDGRVDVPVECNSCHGSESSNAPPRDLTGATAKDSIGVGAHQAHLSGGSFSRTLSCGECHEVPSSLYSEGHLDDTEHAEVVMSGVAATAGRQSFWDRDSATCSESWCHGPSSTGQSSPVWTAASGLSCDSCHTMPPPSPHPQSSDCAACHADVVSGEPGSVTIIDRELHVDGVVQVF